MPKNIVIDSSELNKLVNGLKEIPKQMPKAFTSALNRTLDQVYTQTGRITRQHFNVKVGEIKDSLTKRKASFSRPRAWIQVRSRRFTMGRFLPGGLTSKSKVARVKIKRSAGYKRVGGDPAAFVQPSPDGNTHVFRRQGKKRYPIELLRTISPTQMVESDLVAPEIQKTASAVLAKRVEHEIQYRLKKVKK